jgi:hypothetical protein
MDVLPNTVYAREAFLPMSFCAADFATNYVPFVDVTDTRKAADFGPRLASDKSVVRCDVNG